MRVIAVRPYLQNTPDPAMKPDTFFKLIALTGTYTPLQRGVCAMITSLSK